ncbi:HAMP domain-containing histidine kinase, partial [Bacteriovoracales bacterium]|nr:HAMP domain-containing histidine kinase [Bacteriovoracales bacterium]
DHLLTLVKERTESLKTEKKLTEQITENFNELAIVKADLEFSKGNLEKIKLKLEEKVKERTLELERKNDRLKEYDYTVAHDLINPIGMILSYIDLHAHSKAKGKERTDEILEKIRFASEKSMDIINGILENLIVEKVDLEKNNLIKILDFSLEQLQVKMEEKNAMIKRDLEVEELMCNDISLTQVFANIISNSLKYSKENERVIIEIASFIKGNNTYITIKDNGTGIEQNKLPLIFDKRERAGAEGSAVKGYGIGLYNVRKMVEDNNGQIEAKSEVNVGTTFTLIFPIDKK